jgi:hypothetical protein
MTVGRFFPHVYHIAHRVGRALQPFRMRDTLALQFLIMALQKRGYRFGDMIFNYPLHLAAESKKVSEEFDIARFRENDVIVLPSRPPMDDDTEGRRRKSYASGTKLEKLLFEGPVARWFELCTRPEVVLTDAAAKISPRIAERQVTVYHQNGSAWYQSLGSPHTGECVEVKGPHGRTSAFLVWERAWDGGPMLLAAFGMAGTETLAWSYHLAMNLDHLICSHPFVMAEMRTVTCERPATMDFAKAWEVEILGAADPLPSPDHQRAA